MNVKYPSVFFTIMIILFLCVPYLSSLLFIEPFPAIILPSGHGKLKISSESIQNVEFECIAYHDSDTLTVPISKLFKSVPAQYYLSIIKNNLGFSNQEGDKFDENNLQLKKWYIKNIGVEIDSFKIIEKVSVRNISVNQLVSTKLISQHTYKIK